MEARSFQESASATELSARYLGLLGLKLDEVFTIDLYPYYLANTAVNGTTGRSMWINVQTYRQDSRKDADAPPTCE